MENPSKCPHSGCPFSPKRHCVSIARYTQKQWGKEQREKYMAALFARMEFLALSPHKGRPRNELINGLRCYREGAHTLFYLTSESDILIVDILHERMDLESRIESWTQQ